MGRNVCPVSCWLYALTAAFSILVPDNIEEFPEFYTVFGIIILKLRSVDNAGPQLRMVCYAVKPHSRHCRADGCCHHWTANL